MTEELKKIKKHFSENLAHLCRDLFPTILEQEGKLFKILTDNFDDNKFLYDDLVDGDLVTEFKNFIYSKYEEHRKELIVIDKTPHELLDEAGYILYECKSEKDIQKFRKYYAEREELCTFHGGRLNNCYVFFAVKKNVDEINRGDFPHPEREDAYGTSVISIQFSRGIRNILSIKNRYNHTVRNPDCTFNNDLDNIIPGLNQSFEKTYGFSNTNNRAEKSFYISSCGYVLANDGRYYKYNYEINGMYYCINNIIINGRREVIDKYKDKEKYLLADYFIIDLMNQRVHTLFADYYTDTFDAIKNIAIRKDKQSGNKIITITHLGLDDSKTIIEINKYNQIIKLYDEHIKKLENDSLRFIEYIEELTMPNITYIGDIFLSSAGVLKTISLPKVKHIGDNFLRDNYAVSKINFPLLEVIGNMFMYKNDKIKEIYLPNVKRIGNLFMRYNQSVKIVRLPNVENIGTHFLVRNKHLSLISLPRVKIIEHDFLYSNTNLQEISLPSLEIASSNFLSSNVYINKANFPNLEVIDDNFLDSSRYLKKINLPNVWKVRDGFLRNATYLNEINMPNLETAGFNFLYNNISLTRIELPKLHDCYDGFLHENRHVEYAYLPKLYGVGNDFMFGNNALVELNLPCVTIVGDNFLFQNESLKRLTAPNITEAGCNFLHNNTCLEYFDANTQSKTKKLIREKN